MNSLYNEYEMMNDKGSSIATLIDSFISTIIINNPDVSLVQLEQIAISSVHAVCGETRLRRSLKKIKRNKQTV
jgi:hypothetical protein